MKKPKTLKMPQLLGKNFSDLDHAIIRTDYGMGSVSDIELIRGESFILSILNIKSWGKFGYRYKIS